MSEDLGEEFILTEKQFLKMMREGLETTIEKIMRFPRIRNKTDRAIVKDYLLTFVSYRDIIKQYKEMTKKGIILIPTVRFNHEEGSMRPGYRHKDAIDEFDRWHKILKNNGKREMYR